MLAMANKRGSVFGTPPGLANRARVSLECVLKALEKFQQPDKYSRTKDNEGRRIEEIDGGWRLLNYEKHRELRDEDDRKEYMREYMRDYRSGKQPVNSVNNVSSCKPQLAQAEAEADTEKELTLSAAPQGPPKKTNGHSKADPRHEVFKKMIFRCYEELNHDTSLWDGSDAKQLSALLKAKPDLDEEKFESWLSNYADSENINRADRPRVFLPKISSYAAGPLTKFGRPTI